MWRKEDRTDHIYRVAADIMCQKGYEATSMNDIADAVGLTKPGIYHYIRGKEDLLFEIMSFGMEMVDEDVIAPAREIADARAAADHGQAARPPNHGARWRRHDPARRDARFVDGPPAHHPSAEADLFRPGAALSKSYRAKADCATSILRSRHTAYSEYCYGLRNSIGATVSRLGTDRSGDQRSYKRVAERTEDHSIGTSVASGLGRAAGLRAARTGAPLRSSCLRILVFEPAELGRFREHLNHFRNPIPSTLLLPAVRNWVEAKSGDAHIVVACGFTSIEKRYRSRAVFRKMTKDLMQVLR